MRAVVRGADDPLTTGADDWHVQGPAVAAAQQQSTQRVLDTYGFAADVTAEQAAILERCGCKEQRVQHRWQQEMREAGGLPAPDALKKLCRKVSR